MSKHLVSGIQTDRLPMAIAEIMDNLDDLIWSLRLPDLMPIYFNRAATQVYGSSCQDLLQDPWGWLEGVVAADRGKVQEAIAKVQVHNSCLVNYRVVTDGCTHYYSARLKVFRDKDGCLIRLDAIATLFGEIGDHHKLEPFDSNFRHKETEAVFLQSESQYNDLVNQQKDLILRSLPDTTITFANDALCDILNCKLEEIMGRKWIDFADTNVLGNLLDNIAALSPQNSSFVVFNRDLRPNGQRGWLQWIKQGVFNRQGQLIEIQSVGRDITTLKQSELALKQLNQELEERIEQRTHELKLSEERNSAILHALPDLLLLLKPDGTCVQCITPSIANQNLFIPIKNHISEVLPPDTLTSQLELYAQAIATGESQIYEHKVIKFGKTFYEEVRISPYREDKLLVIVRDITARKHAEEKLLKSDAHLKTAQRIGKIGSWEYNIQTDKATWSEEVFRIFGRDPAMSEPSYLELENYIHPDDFEYFNQTVWNAVQNCQPFSVEYRICHADGTLMYVSVKAEIICDATGQPVQIVGTVLDISDRKATEQQLQSLTDRLTLAVKSAAIGIWEWDIVHNSLFWDERTYELYAINPDPNVDAYSAWAMRLHPSDQEVTEIAVQQALIGEKEYDAEFRIMLPDGNVRHIKAYGLVQRNSQGDPLRLIGINFDVTSRKLAEEQILKNETHLKTAQRIAKIGSWEYEIVTGNIVWSEEVYRVYGLDSQLPTPSYNQLQHYIHPEDWQCFDQTVKTAMQTGQSYDLEHRIVHTDGAIVYAFARGEIIFDANGNMTHIIGTVMDVTDRKLAELELVRSRDLREGLFNESTDALFLVDPQTLLTTDCNLPAVALFEAKDKSQLIGIEGHILQRYQFSSEELQEITLDINKHGFWSREVEYVTLKGKYFWGNLAVKVIEIAGKSINLVRVSDISDRKRFESQILKTSQQLESINHELESFCYSVSHDLRAPLRHINGFVNALRQQIDQQSGIDDPKISHYLEIIDQSSQKMGHLIDGLLSLSRYGRRPLEFKPLKVRTLVDAAIEIICGDSDCLANVQFEIGELPDVVGDPTLLEQVFRNLISNAIKFSRNHSHPCVSITSRPDGTIMIQDNGVGFQMEYADKLFGAFQRLHSERDFEGTGIGLAIVQRIVQRHHGKVWAESQPNQGATFFIQI